MEKVILFLCDICGTINGKLFNSDEDYSELNKLLNLISEKNENCKIIFTLVSSENVDTVKENLNELKKHLKNNVHFDKQFYENGYILENNHIETISGKMHQITEYIEEQNKKFKIIKIYYADDSTLLQSYVSEYFEYKEVNIPLISIIPNERLGLKELNKLINDQIIEKNKNR